MKKKKERCPKFKPIIKEKIEVHIEGDNTYYEASSLKRAKEMGAYYQKKAKEEWYEERNAEKLEREENEDFKYQIEKYIELLTQELWYEARDEFKTKTKKEIALKREIRNTLKKLLLKKLEMGYSSGIYSRDRGRWYLKEPEEDEE